MHTSPDVLALLALGEDTATPGERAHLDDCLACRAELSELARAAQIGERTTTEDTMHQPHARVWAAVRRELGFDAPLADVTPLVRADGVSRPAAGSSARRPSRLRRGLAAGLAAAIALVAGFGLGINWNRLTEPSAVAATMNALPRWAGSTGRASVETEADGSKVLVVRVETAESAVGREEVWLSDVRAQRMMSVGYLENGSGRFAIPASVDLSQRPVVDVSAEPVNDTDPVHSGNSIVRCRLPV